MSKISIRLLLFFLLLRIVFELSFGVREITGDSGSYNSYALAILGQNDWLTNPIFFGNSREPGYPLFLSLVYLLFGKGNFNAVYIIQAFISVFTLYYIYRLSTALFGKKKSILTLVWAGLYINYLKFTGLVLRETLVFFLIILVFYYLWLFINKPWKIHVLKNRNFWQFIIFFTVLIHTDARYIFFIPFLLILFISYLGYNAGLIRYLWSLLFIVVLLIPWSVRNYIAYDAFVLINSRSLDMRESDDRKEVWEKRMNNNLINFGTMTHVNVSDDYPSENERALIKAGSNPNARSDEEISIIKQDIYPDSTFIGRKIYWIKEFWRIVRFQGDYFPFPDARFQGKWSLKHNVSSILCYGTLLPFAVIGLFVMYNEKNKALLFLAFPIVIQTLLHMFMWSRDRYRMPIDAFIIIIAVYGMFWCLDKYNERKYNAIIEK